MDKKAKNQLLKGFKSFLLLLATTMMFTKCSENIDDSNLYTFTGQTIEDFLKDSTDYSDFNYILTRIGYNDILASYGTYTCFAPNNQAVESYVDSLYNDTLNVNLPHNGMTQPGLEGLTDSLCQDIALFHLLYTEVYSVSLSTTSTYTTILGRDLNVSIDPNSGEKVINKNSKLVNADNEMENGILHTVNHVFTRSNNLINGEFDDNPQFSIFDEALIATSLGDSLTQKEKKGLIAPTPATTGKGNGAFIPKTCKVGYTVFAETNDVFEKYGITDLASLKAYADKVYAHAADNGDDGWYDYMRDNNIKVSTGTDYTNPWNTLNMFLRYHIVKYSVSKNHLTHEADGRSYYPIAPIFNYYETMLPNTMLKVDKRNGEHLINRWVENNTLTDGIAQLASASMARVRRPGILVGDDNINADNGYIHNIDDMLVYDKDVPQGVLNERLRFDLCDILGELMTNNFRQMSGDEVKQYNDGKNSGGFGNAGGPRLPENYFNNLKVYNGNTTQIYYLPGQDIGWQNYQGDEVLILGDWDIALRLPPVPQDGTYELRMGFSSDGMRGMSQVYLGQETNDKDRMTAVGIPLDMRVRPVDNGVPDPQTGWINPDKTDDQGVASDQSMRYLGWMRAPMSYRRGGRGGLATDTERWDREVLRCIIGKLDLKQGNNWVRLKSVINDKAYEFHLDYIELVPENVYNNARYMEDMF